MLDRTDRAKQGDITNSSRGMVVDLLATLHMALQILEYKVQQLLWHLAMSSIVLMALLIHTGTILSVIRMPMVHTGEPKLPSSLRPVPRTVTAATIPSGTVP